MQTIYKYRLDSSVEMPKDARILHIAYQGYEPFVWAEVDTERAMEVRKFEYIGTGWDLDDIPKYHKYIGTLHDKQGFVWHYYEIL